jgi:hypothetical protein
MASKLSLWFKVICQQSEHTANAARAENASTRVVGKGTLVEKHLKRISTRERLMAQFAGHIANSPALNDWEKEE